MILRRLLLLSIVLASLAGCTTLERACGMLPVESVARPIPESGSVRVDWLYRQKMPFERYGESYAFNGQLVVRMAGEPPSFDDICGLAKLGHEVAHQWSAHR